VARGSSGSNYVRRSLREYLEPDDRLTVLDALTYAGNPANLDRVSDDPRYSFVKGDIRDAEVVSQVVPGHNVVVHFAAESHVDRSIEGPSTFMTTNVLGTR
jgi:dTDP-glucose 4,6-dehydratase